MQLVDAARQTQVARAGRARQVVHRTAAQAQQLRLASDGQVVVSVDQGFALSNPALVSARSKKSFSKASWPIWACKRGEVHWRCGLAAGTEDVGGTSDQLALPLDNLAGVQLERLAQLGHRLVVAQGGQRHLRLERRTMDAPRTAR